MDFILPFKGATSPNKIFYEQYLMFIGSCFTEEMGERLKSVKFNVLQNPNGILYDPLSIASALHSYLESAQITEDEIFEYNDLFHSWNHHSAFSGAEPESVVAKINHSLAQAHDSLLRTNWLFITFGTAYYYKLKANQQSVANCHKLPSDTFEKYLVEIGEAFEAIQDAVRNIHNVNAACRIVLTVSPVRHVKDGVIENSRSKARLIEICHLLATSDERINYFPSYELVIDVLRDYRFFKKDLVHVNESGVDFIFNKFCNAYFDPETLKLMKQVEAIKLAMEHEPFYPESQAHKHFLRHQLQQIKNLMATNPSFDFSQEIKYFSVSD